MTLFAGANGAGKSTLARGVLAEGGSELLGAEHVLDPDATGDTSPVAAGRAVLARAHALIGERTSFAIETTLSGHTASRLIGAAKAAGYEVRLCYIGTENVEINLGRIERRVAGGGHHVPEEDVRRRYDRSLANVRDVLRSVDEAALIDNSTDDAFRVVAEIEGGRVFRALPFAARPSWANGILQEIEGGARVVGREESVGLGHDEELAAERDVPDVGIDLDLE